MDKETNPTPFLVFLSSGAPKGHLFPLSVATLQRFTDSILIPLGSTLLLPSVHTCQFGDCLLTIWSFFQIHSSALGGSGRAQRRQSLGVSSCASGGMSQLLSAAIMDQKIGFSNGAVLPWGRLIQSAVAKSPPQGDFPQVKV